MHHDILPHDDVYLLSHRVMNLGETVLDLEKESSKFGLKINSDKSKILNLMGHRTLLTQSQTMNLSGHMPVTRTHRDHKTEETVDKSYFKKR